MNKETHSSKSILYSQVTATVSVALVLLMLGAVAILGLCTRNVARSVEDTVGFTVVVSDTMTAADVNALASELKSAPYAASVTYVSREQVLARWNKMLGEADTLLDVNPFQAEIDVKVSHQWANSDSLETIAGGLRERAGVSEVSTRSEMADALEETLRTVEMVMIVVAALLALISFVLISNTVRLSVYGRRHVIRAMQLVGATPGFIRRPFVTSALVSGLVAALAATLILGGALAYIWAEWYEPIIEMTGVENLCIVAAGLFVTGSLISVIAAALATNRYLRSTEACER